ncbi:unnamed protein product, partial [Cylicostephanus goldi]
MSRPALLDEDLYERAADLQREIEEEALAKKLKKEKPTDRGTGMTTRRRRKKKVDEDAADNADNSEDLIEEATQIINNLEKERMKKTKKKKRRRHSWSDSSESSDTEISEASDSEEDDEIEQEEEDMAGTSGDIDATENTKERNGKRKRIRSDSSSESAISESNIVDEPRKKVIITRKNEKK